MAHTQTQNEAEIDAATIRLNVNLNAETAEALRKISKRRDISLTEAVRRAISVYEYFEDEASQGRRIQTTDTDRGNVRELVLI